MAKRPDKKLCFVVGAIGQDDSEERVHADWLLESIIDPVFNEHFPEFDVKRADKISNPGRIDEQIITSLLTAELVIADLTGLNPNAFYEIGIRHTIQKPIIHMHLDGQRIPFDIASFRSISFSRRLPKDLTTAKEKLKLFVQTVIVSDYEVDNPVTFSRGKVLFDLKATPEEKIIQNEMIALSDRVSKIENGDLKDIKLDNKKQFAGASSKIVEIKIHPKENKKVTNSEIDTIIDFVRKNFSIIEYKFEDGVTLVIKVDIAETNMWKLDSIDRYIRVFGYEAAYGIYK